MEEKNELKNEQLESVSGGTIDAEGDDVLYEFTDYFNSEACKGLVGKLIKYKSSFRLTGSGKARVTRVGTGDVNGLILDNGAEVLLGMTDAKVWVLNESSK